MFVFLFVNLQNSVYRVFLRLQPPPANSETVERCAVSAPTAPIGPAEMDENIGKMDEKVGILDEKVGILDEKVTGRENDQRGRG